MPRKLIENALNIVERHSRNRGIPRLIVEAPTGYGKTVGAPLMFNIFAREFSHPSFIHVLPLRAIVHDFYLCILINALTGSCELKERCNRNEQVLYEIGKALKEIGIKAKDVAYQMGEIVVNEYARKEPLFDARYIVTTFDSFIYNLFRIPVTEIFSSRKHYAIPRLRIFLSSVYLDEAHMIFEEKDEEPLMYTTALTAIRVLKLFHIPLVIVSATLGKSILDKIGGELEDVVIIRLGKRDVINGRCVEISDPDFVEAIEGIRWRTTMIKSSNVVDKALENIESFRRVFLAFDNIRHAIDCYQKMIKSGRVNAEDVVLIHGLMTREDRIKAINRINKAKVLIATSVVEAGVDFSFDVLITEGHRISSVVQRCGRVCRYHQCEEAQVMIIEEYSNKLLIDFINNVHDKGKNICWRLPFDINNNYIGYSHLVDLMETPKINTKLMRSLEAIVSPLIVGSNTINSILSEYNYSLVRIGLIETIVGEPIELKGLNHIELLMKSIVMPMDRVNKIIERNCVKSITAFYGNDEVYEIKDVCTIGDVVDNRGNFNFKRYVECLKKAIREKRDFMQMALLIDSNCYKAGVGLII